MTVYTGYGVAAIDDLKAIAPSDREDGMWMAVKQKLTWYMFDATSETTGNDDTVVEPTTGTGRWKMQKDNAASGGSGSGVNVQNGQPNEAPTAIGQAVADNRSDRGILWVATGTDSANDWKPFGFRPIRGNGVNPNDSGIVGDFPGQFYVGADNGGSAFTLYVYSSTFGWMNLINFSNS